MDVSTRWERRAAKMGLPYSIERTGWSGGNKYGWRPVFSLRLSDADGATLMASVEADAKKLAKAKAARRKAAQEQARAREAHAASMGLLPDSRTYRAYLAGEIEREDAEGIGRYMAHRHEDTDYDSLLSSGMSKDDARALMQETA